MPVSSGWLPRADLLFLNGLVLTLAGPPARALAVRGDRVLAMGSEEDLLALRGPRTRVVDLRGRAAIPGFHDCHAHVRDLGRRLSLVRLEDAASLAEALRRVAARARATPRGEWVTGGGFDKNCWGESFPTRWDLDRVAPEHPVALSSRDGHSLWVNSLALQRCRVGRRTACPAGGVVLRDARREPTGIFQERAQSLIYGSPAYHESRSPGELEAGLRELVRHGITSVHAMEDLDALGELQRLAEARRLPARVTVYCGVSALDELLGAGLRSGFGNEWVRLGGVKAFVDGALGSQTAWLWEPYEGREDCGLPVFRGDELRAAVHRAAAGGLACAVHAIGDRANSEALDALEAVRGAPTPLPHRIEHAQLVRPRDLRRFAALGVTASMQPCHILGDVDAAERYWGRRCRWAYPVRSLLRAGTRVIFGSDAPVETYRPLRGLAAAVLRQTWEGQPAGGWYRREEGIGRLAALRAYTAEPARVTGEGAAKGKLAPGYLADVVVLSQDPLRAPLGQLAEVRTEMVFVGGRLRWQARRPR